jgi:hypothetical protein
MGEGGHPCGQLVLEDAAFGMEECDGSGGSYSCAADFN